MAIQRFDNHGANGALLSRTEVERVTGTVVVRTYNGSLVLQNTRNATAVEAARFTDWETADTTETNTADIRTKAATALTNNAAFLAIATPTAAQNAAQAKALTRQVNGLIRLLLGQLADVSDT